MLEMNGKMSQAQEVRATAFHMATQLVHMDHNRHGGPPSAEDLMRRAEEIEVWLWRAQEGQALRELVRHARRAADALEDGHMPVARATKAAADLRQALVPFEV